MSNQLAWANQTSLSPVEQAWLDEHPTIRISGPKSFPPFQFIGADGTFQGMANDYIQILADMFNLKVVVIKGLPWPKVLQKIKGKEIDVLSCATQSADRASYLTYTNPHFSFPLVIITRKDSPFISNIQGLNNVKVACIRKVSTYEWLKRDKVEINPHFVNSPIDALNAVSLGSAEATIQNLATATYLIEKNGLTNLKIAAPTSYGNYNLSIAIRKDWPELASIFNKGLETLSQRKHNEIRQKWIAVRYEHGIQKSDVIMWILWGSLFSTILLTAFYFWNRALKKEINEREQAEKSLIESEERFKALHDATFGGVVIHDKGLILDCNKGLSDITGFTNEELVGMNGLKLIAPDWLDLVLENIRNGYEKSYEVEGVRKDGSVYPLAIRGKNITYKGQPVRVIEFRDITEKTNLEEQLRQAHKMEAIGTLAGGIAHDFNNILTAVIGYAELAKLELPQSFPAREHIGEVLKASNRAKELVQHILSFSRTEASKLVPVKISLIAYEALKLLRASIPTTIEIKENIDPNCGYVLANQTKIHQVFMNLCTNASQAMEENGGVLSVTVSMVEFLEDDLTYRSERAEMKSGTYVKITVCDTGPGIAPQIINRIFDPYFTTKGTGKGSGMGLAVSHGIVKSFGGIIEVESKGDSGTSFHVYFPRVEQNELQEIIDPEVENKLVGGIENILFVDDEKSIVAMNELRLKQLGYKVTTSTKSSDALELFRAQPNSFDLVITDQTMPQITGEQLAQELLSIRPDIPIILCTGYSSSVNAEKASQIGIMAFVMKPIQYDLFAKTIRRVLDAS